MGEVPVDGQVGAEGYERCHQDKQDRQLHPGTTTGTERKKRCDKKDGQADVAAGFGRITGCDQPGAKSAHT